MSYDIYLTMDAGGPEPMYVDCGNMTSNVAPMWRLAGANLAGFQDKTAEECLPLLRQAITAMEDDPAPYKALNPANGWGDYDSCLGYLRELVTAFVRHPKAKVDVSR